MSNTIDKKTLDEAANEVIRLYGKTEIDDIAAAIFDGVSFNTNSLYISPLVKQRVKYMSIEDKSKLIAKHLLTKFGKIIQMK
jgi:predicted metallopeptidase